MNISCFTGVAIKQQDQGNVQKKLAWACGSRSLESIMSGTAWQQASDMVSDAGS